MFSVQDRVKKNTLQIMKHKKWCAYSGVIACGKVKFGGVPTAATNGWDVIYNEGFIREHCPTDAELRFLMLHEATHKAYRHLHVWRALHEEDHKRANIAADHFVNLALVNTDAGEGFIEMLDVGIEPDQKYKGWSVVQIFHDLKKDGKGGGGEGGCEGEDEPEDGEGNGKPGEDGEGGFDSHDWDGAKEMDAAKKEQQATEIERAIRQGEMMRKKLAGKGAGGAQGAFGDLLNPKIDWKKVLRDFVSELCAGHDESSWRKPNRRFLSEDILLPTLLGTTMTELVIGFDTSGSCFGGDIMTRFVTEITTIVSQVAPKKIHVLYVDTEVAGHQVFEDGQFAVQSLKPAGGGGTELPVAFDYLKEKRIKPDAMVFFTDGYTEFGTAPAYPILWACTTEIVAPYGTTIRVEIV